MRGRTVTGKPIYHQILTEAQLTNLSAPSNLSAQLYCEDCTFFIFLSRLSVFIFRYQDKKWASGIAVQPGQIVGSSRSVEGGARVNIPKKARKYSLEEEILSEQISKVTPTTTKHRWVTLFFH